jgi:glycyl-tRNA synthetase beta chain
MDTQDLLFEIGTEEIPARFMPGAIKQLQEKAAELFRDNRLHFREVVAYGTPRRLVLFVKDLAGKQDDREEKKKGPSIDVAFDQEGNPTKASLGFAGKLGLKVEELQVERSDKGEYLMAVLKVTGKKTPQLLAELLPTLVKSINFPKNMYWQQNGVRFARPIRWLLCLYGSQVIPFSFAGVKSGRETRGHRTVPDPLVIKNPDHYFKSLEEAGVIVAQNKRADMILEGVKAAAEKFQKQACIDPDLLEEVTFLVEQPEAIPCSFPEEYLELPREVLVTTMQKHQRFFPVEDQKGKISPFFVAVSNNRQAPSSNVRRGNEKVLNARLADARFFYSEDLKTPLEKKVTKLEQILFQEELGTVYDKTRRLVSLTRFLTEHLPCIGEEQQKGALRAAYLSKADLATSMVGEFPELQGIMGREYALKSGEREATATAIYEHYLPRFAGDALPVTFAGIILALADKADHLAGCFAIGIRPTGSQDPYALRRQSLGILQILLEHKVPVSFEEIIGRALTLLKTKLNDLDEVSLVAEIKSFAWQRLRYLFQEKGIDYDIVESVLNIPLGIIEPLWQRALFLQNNRDSSVLSSVAESYVRVANLARQASPDHILKEELLIDKAEGVLYQSYLIAREKATRLLPKNDLQGVLLVLAGLKDEVDIFFDEVMVMVEDEIIRNNRLKLLQKIQKLYLTVADFSKIVFRNQS